MPTECPTHINPLESLCLTILRECPSLWRCMQAIFLPFFEILSSPHSQTPCSRKYRGRTEFLSDEVKYTAKMLPSPCTRTPPILKQKPSLNNLSRWENLLWKILRSEMVNKQTSSFMSLYNFLLKFSFFFLNIEVDNSPSHISKVHFVFIRKHCFCRHITYLLWCPLYISFIYWFSQSCRSFLYCYTIFNLAHNSFSSVLVLQAPKLLQKLGDWVSVFLYPSIVLVLTKYFDVSCLGKHHCQLDNTVILQWDRKVAMKSNHRTLLRWQRWTV